MILEFLECGVPGWVLVTDNEGTFHWVNEEHQELNSEPPNLTELKEMFQKVRRDHIRQKNNPTEPRTAQKQVDKPPGRTQQTTHSTPDGLRGTSGAKQRSSQGTFELTNTEPRQTYEHSRAKLDPRQALFESRENTHQGHNDDLEDRDLLEVQSQEELSQGLESDEQEDYSEPGAEARDSNYQVFDQLQKELQAVKKMYKDLELENHSLKSAQHRLTEEIDDKRSDQSDPVKIQDQMPESPRFSEARQIVRKREDYLGLSSGNKNIGNELYQIRKLLENSIKVQTENLERQRQSTLLNSQMIQGQRLTSDDNSKGQPSSIKGQLAQNPYIMSSKVEPKPAKVKSGPQRIIRKQSDGSSNQRRGHESNGTWTDSLGRPNSRPFIHASSQHSSVKASKDSLSSDFLNKKKRRKEKLTSLGVMLYHKWKDIVGMEHGILCQTAEKLEKDRMVLRHRKAAVQKFEWDMLWSIRDDLDKQASKQIIGDIKHTIFGYELEAEKSSTLTSIFEVRLKKMKLIEKSLDFALKSGNMSEKTDEYLTMLFTQYIDVANLFEHKLRINTRSLNPYRKSQETSDIFASYKGSKQNLGHINQINDHQSRIDNLYSKISNSKSTVDPNLSHIEFLRQTLSKVKETVPADNSLFLDVCSYFESQSSWFETINEEIKTVMRRLTNPTNMSAIH